MIESTEAASQAKVKVAQAKGRPMLSWVGKRPLREVVAFPAQEVERFGDREGRGASTAELDWSDWPPKCPRGGLLFHGDNKEVLAHLLANGFRGKVDLVYIDPPFDSGANYVRQVQLRGASGAARLEGESYTLGEQIQYTDIWANDNYLQFMYERLLLLGELLSPDGSVYLHCDPRKSHHLRCLLDEVLGSASFVSEIVWQSADAQSSAKRYGPIHNTIFYYARPGNRTWNDVRTPLSKSTADSWYTHEELLEKDIVNRLGVPLKAGTVRRFNTADLTARKPGGDTQYEWKGVRPPAGRFWAYSKENMAQFEQQGLLTYSKSGRPYLKRYLDEVEGTPPQDLWTDISMIRGISSEEDTGYPTEKPEPLLERIVRVSSRPGDVVLDCFIGSGTAAAVAQKLGRRWIGCDINKGAIQTTTRRLMEIMRDQVAAKNGQASLPGSEGAPKPAQLSFASYRVNDYDLAIQHNEAVSLACEHMGIVRSRTDGFFDGTLGKELAKIVEFNHPASPADLEAVAREIRSRPEEDRDVVAVCLGKELACDAWLADYNRKGAPNKIRLVELRTDPKYGQFFAHEPASAEVSVSRQDGRILVAIEDFVSPTIVTRLRQQAGVVAPHIEDWRAMVDSVMIDASYDGQVFDIELADVPEKRSDLVRGSYDLPALSGPTTVAVKITDMLGEEVLVTQPLD